MVTPDEWLARFTQKICKADKRHAPITTRHEGLSIIQEEVFELQDLVYADGQAASNAEIVNECVSIAAAAFRMARDLSA